MDQGKQAIRAMFLSQEDLLESGCLDFELAIGAAESALLAKRQGEVVLPEKIVQIFDDDTQERSNCLPATLLGERVCGVRWVSVFLPNVARFGRQNLTALFVLSEIEKRPPSNVRVGAIGGGDENRCARRLAECRVSAKTAEEEEQFVRELGPILSDIGVRHGRHRSCPGDGRGRHPRDRDERAGAAAARRVDAAGVVYSHFGGWEDEYEVAQQCDTIVCERPGREHEEERVYFNALDPRIVDHVRVWPG